MYQLDDAPTTGLFKINFFPFIIRFPAALEGPGKKFSAFNKNVYFYQHGIKTISRKKPKFWKNFLFISFCGHAGIHIVKNTKISLEKLFHYQKNLFLSKKLFSFQNKLFLLSARSREIHQEKSVFSKKFFVPKKTFFIPGKCFIFGECRGKILFQNRKS